MIVDLATDIATTSIPGTIDTIRTTGYSTLGIGSALYVRDGTNSHSAKGAALRSVALSDGLDANDVDAALAATEGRFRFEDANGNYWTLSTDQSVNDTMFGAIHDATYNDSAAWDSRWSGTDNRAAVQAMIDWTLYFGGTRRIHFAKGNCLIGDTVHIGYGESFTTTLELIGLGPSLDGSFLATGPIFVRNFVGEPLFNIQGARRVRFETFSTQGVHFKDINGNYLANPAYAPALDDTDPENWKDVAAEAALGRSVDHRYAPDAAITVDAYSGTRPGTSYGDADYPAWLGAASQTQWGKAKSSDIFIEGNFRGEINAVVTHPSGSDGNGDFVRFGQCAMERCKRFLSVSHTQCRSVAIEYLSGGQCYEVISNRTHGLQAGQLNGGFDCITVSGLMQLASIGSTARTGSLSFNDCYIEAGYRLLELDGLSSVETPITFNNLKASFDLHDANARGIPAYMIRSTTYPSTAVPVIFNGGTCSNYYAFASTARLGLSGGAHFESKIAGATGTSPSAPECMAHNATLGNIIALEGVQGAVDVSLALRNVDNPSAGVALTRVSDGFRGAARPTGFPVWLNYAQTRAVVPEANCLSADALVPNPFAQYASAGGGNLAWREVPPALFSSTGTTSDATGFYWHFTYNSYRDSAEWVGYAAGDILHDPDSGITFTVDQFDTTTREVRAKAMCGIKQVSGNWVPIGTFDDNGGSNIRSLMTRRYIPQYPVFVDLTAASNVGANLGYRNGDKVPGGTIAVGDRWETNERVDDLFASSNLGSRITAIDFAAGTVSFTGNAARTIAGQRMAVCHRTVANAS